MKKFLTILLFLLSIDSVFAQTVNTIIKNDIEKLNIQIVDIKATLDSVKTENLKMKADYSFLENSQSTLKLTYNQLFKDFISYKSDALSKIDSLENVIINNSATFENTANELEAKIETTEKSASQGIIDLSKTINKNTLYWIMAILIIALLVVLVFIILRKQIFKQSDDLVNKIQDTRKNLEEEGIKLDNKLIEIFETQLKLVESNNQLSSKKNETIDHTLALKVADEIVRIEKNLSKIDKSTKGIKPLEKGIERIKDNFKANGYEMVQLLELEYNEGMNIDVINFIDDESIQPGKKIITRIIKPQVNFNDVLIQRAQVDVSQN